MTPFLGLPLLLESLLTVAWVTSLLSTLVVYGPVALSLILARGAVGALQFAAGWMLLSRRPPGPALGRLACISSAVLMVAEVGFRLGPTNVDPSLRWFIVGAYGVYAAVMAILLARLR